MERRYSVGADEQVVKIEAEDGGGYRVRVGAKTYVVQLRRTEDGVLTLDIDGRRVRAVVAPDGGRRWTALDGVTRIVEPSTGRKAQRDGSGRDTLTAAMPGQVAVVHVQAGDEVEKGQTLVLLEAMKMELHVTAPRAGRVKTAHVKRGDVVKRGQTLVELES